MTVARADAFDVPSFLREVNRRYREGSGEDVPAFLRGELARARSLGSEDGVIAVLNELGSVCRVRGELPEAEALYLETVALLDRRAGDVSLARATARINLGDVYVAWGRNIDAVRIFDEAEALISCPEKHPYELSAICNNRSAAWRGQGRLSEARRDLRRADALLDEVPGTQGERAVNGINLAEILLQEGRLDEAEATIRPVLLAYETLSGGRDIHRSCALATAARIAWLHGDYELASERYGGAVESLADKLGESATVAALRTEQARVDRLRNRLKGHGGV